MDVRSLDALRRLITPPISAYLSTNLFLLFVYLTERLDNHPNPSRFYHAVESLHQIVSYSCFVVADPIQRNWKNLRRHTLIIGDSLLRDQHTKFYATHPNLDVLCYPGKTINKLADVFRAFCRSIDNGEGYLNQESGLKVRLSKLNTVSHIIIHCGTNNVSTKYSESDLDDILKMYENFINWLFTNESFDFSGLKQVTVTDLIPRNDEDSQRLDMLNRKMVMTFSRLRAEHKRVVLYKISDEFDAGDLAKDQIHLSDKGKKKFHAILGRIEAGFDEKRVATPDRNPVQVVNIELLSVYCNWLVKNGCFLDKFLEIALKFPIKCDLMSPVFFNSDRYIFSHTRDVLFRFLLEKIKLSAEITQKELKSYLNQSFKPLDFSYSPSVLFNLQHKITAFKNGVTIPPVIPPRFDKDYVRVKYLIFDTNLYLENSAVPLLSNLVMNDFFAKFGIKLIVPSLVRVEISKIASQNESKRSRAVTAMELLESLTNLPEIEDMAIPVSITKKEVTNRNQQKQSKSVDDILLDFSIFIEQQVVEEFTPIHIGLSHVMFVTHDKNLQLKAISKFSSCGLPKPFLCQDIKILENLYLKTNVQT